LPGFGPQLFKVVVHSATTRNKGGAGFRMAKGRGWVEVKCDAHLPVQDGEASEEYVVRREGSQLGVDLASEDSRPWCVKSITGGLFEQWNLANPACQVAPGDRIISANGASGSAGKVRDERSNAGTLRLVMQRGQVDTPRFQVSFGVGPGSCAVGGQAPAMRGPVLHSFAR